MHFQFVQPDLAWLLLLPACLTLLFVGHRVRLSAAACLVAASLAIMAAAGFQAVTNVSTEVYSRHVVVGLADDSGSMSRCLEPFKYTPCSTAYNDIAIGFDRFTSLRQTDTVAITLFSDTLVVLTSPSQTRKETITALRNATPRFNGTDALVAFNSAIAQFKLAPAGDRVLVLMSDGEFDLKAEDIESIGKQLKELKVSVHWILPDWDKLGPYGRDAYKLMGIVHGRIYEVYTRTDISDAFLKIALVEEPRVEAQSVPTTTDLSLLLAIGAALFGLFAAWAACCCRDRGPGPGPGRGPDYGNKKGDVRYDVGDGKVVIVRSEN